MSTVLKGKNKKEVNKRIGALLLVVTPSGLEARHITIWEGGQIVDSEGTEWTHPMLKVGELDGQRCYYAVLDTVAFQRLQELSAEMKNIIFSAILRTQTSAKSLVQWVILAMLGLSVIILFFQVQGLSSAFHSELGEVNATLQLMLSRLSGVQRIDP